MTRAERTNDEICESREDEARLRSPSSCPQPFSIAGLAFLVPPVAGLQLPIDELRADTADRTAGPQVAMNEGLSDAYWAFLNSAEFLVNH